MNEHKNIRVTLYASFKYEDLPTRHSRWSGDISQEDFNAIRQLLRQAFDRQNPIPCFQEEFNDSASSPQSSADEVDPRLL
jgi:hypothetical protein